MDNDPKPEDVFDEAYWNRLDEVKASYDLSQSWRSRFGGMPDTYGWDDDYWPPYDSYQSLPGCSADDDFWVER